MSKEFIVLAAIELVGLIMNTVTLIVLLVSLKKRNAHEASSILSVSKPNKFAEGAGIVFCRNCGKQYDVSYSICPNCKMPH